MLTKTLSNTEKMEIEIKKKLEIINSGQRTGVEPMMKPSFVDCNFESNTLTLEFPVLKWELNPLGIMHGGIITSAFDNTYGLFTHYKAGEKFVTTVEISTSFLKPVALGDSLIVKVIANSVGRTIISMTGKAYLKSNDVLAATSSSTFMILDKKVTHFK